MRLTDFFQDSLIRMKGKFRSMTLMDRAKTMRDCTECIGDIDVQDVRYELGERFIQYCLTLNLTASTITKKVKQLKRIFQLAEDRGQLDRHSTQAQAAERTKAEDPRVHRPGMSQPMHDSSTI